MKLVKVTEITKITLTIRKNVRIHEKETISDLSFICKCREIKECGVVACGLPRARQGHVHPGPGISKGSPDMQQLSYCQWI